MLCWFLRAGFAELSNVRLLPTAHAQLSALYLVAKTQCIINISIKLTNETRLRNISTKHWLHLKWYASERPLCKVNTKVLTWKWRNDRWSLTMMMIMMMMMIIVDWARKTIIVLFFLSISKWVLWLVSWKPSHESRNWNESSFGRRESSFTDLLTYRRR